jgi:hypothetical protein
MHTADAIPANEGGAAMVISEFLVKALFALACGAAIPLVALWIAFTCREIWQAHESSRLRRTQASDADANSTV